AGAIAAASANAARAGVSADIAFHQRPLSASEPLGDRGLVAVNPPYGVRVGARSADLRDLYARLGRRLLDHFAEWDLALLSPDARLDGQLGFPLEERFTTTNGGIRVRLVTRAVGDA